MTAESTLNRRLFLGSGAAMVVGAAGAIGVGKARASEADHSGIHKIAPVRLKAIVNATASCQQVGQACLAFSAKQLGEGMTQMSRCQKSCINMLALTGAMLTVATHATADAEIISELAAATAKACHECEAACDEFEALAYKKCAQSCHDTARVCEDIARD